MADVGRRMFFEELSRILGQTVTVELTDNRIFIGEFEGFNPASMSICLTNTKNEEGNEIPLLFLNGNLVSKIYITEKPFDLAGLAARIEKVFPRMVKV